MALGTAGAIIGSAIIGSGASALAAGKAANASQRATDATTAAQNRALDTQQQNTAVQRATGDASLNALATQMGLDNGTNRAAPDYADYVRRHADLKADQTQDAINRGLDPNDPAVEAEYGQRHWTQYGDSGGHSLYAPSANTGVVDSQGAYTASRPSVGAAPVYEAPAYRETAIDPLDVSLSKYEKSPDYEFQLDQGNRNILATASATGGLESGAALKALQKFGQDLAMGDYGQWRDYATGQYNQDRVYTANRDDAYNAFGSQQAQNKFNAANSTYQFGNTLAQNMYNSDRDYATNRYDTRTNNLLSLAGYGQNATNAYGNALGQNATNLSNAYFSNASNQGNAALATGGAINNALSNGASALAYYYGNKPQTASVSTSGWSA